MSSKVVRHTRFVIVAALLAAALTGCASLSLPGGGSGSKVESPDGSTSTSPGATCGVSGERVNSIVDDVLTEVGTVQDSVLAGEFPDLQALLAPLEGDLRGLTEGVTDPALLAALESVQAAVLGFGDIPAPKGLLDAPGYLKSITGQLEQLRSASTNLQQLCKTP